jgi:hypothetical protein
VPWTTNMFGDLDRTIEDPSRRTRDMGGPLGTEACTEAVIDAAGRSSAA